MPITIGIRREDKNAWERRAPLTPEHVAALRKEGVRIQVQPSPVRVFPDPEYAAAGAVCSEDLSSCELVLAIKEIPEELFRDGCAYLFFSHVAKGQAHNMKMLGRLLGCGATLIDYEHIVDETRRRRVFFGNHAGSAGLFETLHALGRRLERQGHATPLSDVPRPLELPDLEEGRRRLTVVGRRIAEEGLGPALAPLVVGFAGYGNVSSGAQEFFDVLPHEQVAPEELDRFMTSGGFSDRKLYKVVFEEKDMVFPVEAGRLFELEDYYAHPERYRGTFERYLPHLTVLFNCIYWDERYPRLVSKAWLRSAWAGAERPRLGVIGDITCDVEGAIECTLKATDPGRPTYTYRPLSGDIADSIEGDGVLVMAVDTLPSEVPREASMSFGDMLLPFVRDLAAADFSVSFHQLALPEILKRAVIVYRGELTEKFGYLKAYLRA